jgi:hypothetical protein
MTVFEVYRRAGAGSIACAAALVLLAQPAGAQDRIMSCWLSNSDESRPRVVCQRATSCTNAEDCVIGHDAECYRSTTLTGLCIRRCSRMFACASDADCPVLGDPTSTGNAYDGRCARLERPLPEDPSVVGLCVYEDPNLQITYCESGGTISFRNVARCHRRADDSVTPNYQEGDCDDDGCPNGYDPEPCNPDVGGSCPMESPRGDQPEACPIGSLVDAGVGDHDAGGKPAGDAGSFDAAPPTELDAGTGEGEGIHFSGGGGCHCAAVGAGRTSAAAAALAVGALALALMLTTRGRRRPR